MSSQEAEANRAELSTTPEIRTGLSHRGASSSSILQVSPVLAGPSSMSARAGPSIRRSSAQGTSSNPVPEVICIDSDSSPKPTHSHATSRGRKMRRLNDSTPVVVLDDDEETPRNVTGSGSSADATSSADLRRPMARGTVGAAVRPVLSRRSMYRAQASLLRARRSRLSHVSEVGGDVLPSRGTVLNSTTRDMPPLRAARRVNPFTNQRNGPRQSAVVRLSNSASGSSSRPLSERERAVPLREGRYAQLDFVVRVTPSSSAGLSTSMGRGGSRRARSVRTPLDPNFLHQVAHSVMQSGARHLELRYISDSLPDYETLVSLDEELLRQRNAAPKTVIDNLQEVVASETDKDVHCVICMSEIQEGEKLRILPCKHKYHKACIDEWLTYNACCPVDKKRICEYQSVQGRRPPPGIRLGAIRRRGGFMAPRSSSQS